MRRTVEVGAVEWVAATTRTEQAGLYYLRARYYDPETGRFMSRDRVGITFPWNHPFAYANSNPAFLTDPEGTVPDPGNQCRLVEGDEPWRCEWTRITNAPCEPDCGYDDILPLLAKQIGQVCKVLRNANGKTICGGIVGAFVEFFANPEPLSDGSCIPENGCYPPITPPDGSDVHDLENQPFAYGFNISPFAYNWRITGMAPSGKE